MKEVSSTIIWDIEDVSPSISSTFVTGLKNYAKQAGRVSTAKVFGNFSKKRYASSANELHRESFEMIHIPETSEQEISMLICAKTMALLYSHPHISHLILISGREELSPLLRQIRELDIRTTVVCDSRKADERLLLLADSFCDFRDLTIVPMEEEAESTGQTGALDFERSLPLLQEAVSDIQEKGIPASGELVRARLKLINERFDEQELGFDSWNGYLGEAQKRGAIHARFKDNELILSSSKKPSPEIIIAFLQAVESSSKILTSEGRRAKLPDIAANLEKQGIDFRAHGYSKLKKVADAAAKRGLVLVSLHESNYFLDLTAKANSLLASVS